MRIAMRLWIALLCAIVLVLGAGVLVRLQEERRLLLEVTLRDRVFFAHALHTAIARDHGSQDPLAEARAMVEREEVAAAHIIARLVSISERSALPRPLLTSPAIDPLARGEVVVGVHEHEIVTYVPIESDGSAVIELVEPQAVDALLTRVGWWSLAAQTLALAAAAGFITFALVGWLVGRPLGRLAILARRIGAGELDARAQIRGNDEVTILASEMNHMAEQLGAARRALEESETERVAALEQLRHADRLRTVGQLSSALAHELGTPLNVVSGHARMIEESSDHATETHGSARTILEQAGRMARSLRDVLDFSRRKGPRRDVHDPAELAAHATRTLAPLTRRHRVDVEVETVAPDARVSVDPQHLMQVLTNLLTNGMQAMPQGGRVRVHVDEIETVPPTGVHAPKGRYVRMTVIDEGTGIEPADIPHLFEPFFTRKAEGEGTGLGLPVAEGIVREHGGWIAVSSEPGIGSRFEVFLPAADASREEDDR
ncbi:MAG: HAMP domain-containing histidine kinase [Myxococcota bacterium]|nr:HAMP domain-containing histidine kinase [Myxococcota bacterium]